MYRNKLLSYQPNNIFMEIELTKEYQELEKAYADFDIAVKNCQETLTEAKEKLAKLFNHE